MRTEVLRNVTAILLVSQVYLWAEPLVYEGFSASPDGSGDDYQHDESIVGDDSPFIEGATDARTGMTGAWSPSGGVGDDVINFDSRDNNLEYAGFRTGDEGVGEWFRTSNDPVGSAKGALRSLSYTTPEEDDFYIVFGWATDDSVALAMKLDHNDSTADQSVNIDESGNFSTAFAGAFADQYSGETVDMSGAWNVMILRVVNDEANVRQDDGTIVAPGNGDNPSTSFYDYWEIWVNPTITEGSGDLTQLGTPDDQGHAVLRNLSNSAFSYDQATFVGSPGNGEQVMFDEFYITPDLSDFLAPPPQGTVVFIR